MTITLVRQIEREQSYKGRCGRIRSYDVFVGGTFVGRVEKIHHNRGPGHHHLCWKARRPADYSYTRCCDTRAEAVKELTA